MLRMDNTVALGIASGATNAKRSKSMDMRFLWLVDALGRTATVCSVAHSWNLEYELQTISQKQTAQKTILPVLPLLGCQYHDNEPKATKQKTVTIMFQKEM
jgi:hypothetical protein